MDGYMHKYAVKISCYSPFNLCKVEGAAEEEVELQQQQHQQEAWLREQAERGRARQKAALQTGGFQGPPIQNGSFHGAHPRKNDGYQGPSIQNGGFHSTPVQHGGYQSLSFQNGGNQGSSVQNGGYHSISIQNGGVDLAEDVRDAASQALRQPECREMRVPEKESSRDSAYGYSADSRITTR